MPSSDACLSPAESPQPSRQNPHYLYFSNAPTSSVRRPTSPRFQPFSADFDTKSVYAGCADPPRPTLARAEVAPTPAEHSDATRTKQQRRTARLRDLVIQLHAVSALLNAEEAVHFVVVREIPRLNVEAARRKPADARRLRDRPHVVLV